MRGLPSSGKTTVANRLAEPTNAPVYSADMFFEKDGNYLFDASKLGQAHQWCEDQVEKEMFLETKQIFVGNTLTTKKELSPYIDLAKKHNYMLVSLIVEKRHENFNNHNVPEETMTKMEERFVVKLR